MCSQLDVSIIGTLNSRRSELQGELDEAHMYEITHKSANVLQELSKENCSPAAYLRIEVSNFYILRFIIVFLYRKTSRLHS